MESLEYKNKDWLQNKFDKFKTVTNVSKETGYPRTCITRYAKKFGIYKSKFNRTKVNTLNEDYFQKIDSEEKAYWLGFIMADGNIHENNKKSKIQFSIKIKKGDVKHLEKFKQAINFSGEVKIRSGIRNNVCNEFCIIQIYNEKFCEHLINNDIKPNKTGNEIIPKSVDEKYYKDFIRGFIDGDGTITGSIEKGKILKVSLCSTNINIINQINDFISTNLNIEMHINLYNNTYTLSCTKKESNYKLLNYLYYDNCIALNRKYNLALKAILEYENTYL